MVEGSIRKSAKTNCVGARPNARNDELCKNKLTKYKLLDFTFKKQCRYLTQGRIAYLFRRLLRRQPRVSNYNKHRNFSQNGYSLFANLNQSVNTLQCLPSRGSLPNFTQRSHNERLPMHRCALRAAQPAMQQELSRFLHLRLDAFIWRGTLCQRWSFFFIKSN